MTTPAGSRGLAAAGGGRLGALALLEADTAVASCGSDDTTGSASGCCGS